ncbi:MAG: hypothetical protein KJ066_19590 [Acidobacteria bacterium]|nr:hypothetical protein [Acidobacteriota bacterium]
MHHLKPPTPFADALALQTVEAFVERVTARVETMRESFAYALRAELTAWREAVPEEAKEAPCD